MTKHNSLILFIITVSLFTCTEKEIDTKPNVVLILADDLGYSDLSCYNSDYGIHTPNIDRLASEGVRFTQFYAPSNICSPSRRALLTGRYQSRLGEWAEAYPGIPTRDAVSGDEEPVFAQYLKKSGYATGCFGKWNIGEVNGVSTPDAQGFDYWIGSFHNHTYFGHKRDKGIKDFWENGILAPQYDGQYSDDVFIDKAIEFIKENAETPFFVYLPLCAVHTPFQDPDDPVEGEHLSWWNDKHSTIGRNPPSIEDRPFLGKMLRHMDTRIGDLLKTLSDLDLEYNTIVIFTSDNGGTPASINEPLSGFKQGVLEGGIRVPAIIKWPGVYPEGTLSSQVGIMMDFSQTIVSATGSGIFIESGRKFDGIDLTPILTGSEEEAERTLGWRRRNWNSGENGFNAVWAEAYIKGDWKYIKEFNETPGYARSIAENDSGVGYVELLYNLKDDISEKYNLAENNPEKLKELREDFERWKSEVVEKDKHYKIPFPDQYEDLY
jgi:arylsulfatase A-like enzyme